MKNALSAATVRNIFADLTDAGFIEQTHTSGGRVPCQRGYRFFVDMILDDMARAGSISEALGRAIAQVEGGYRTMHTFQSMLARNFHVLSRFGDNAPIGFEEIFREPEFQETSLMREFGKFLDEFGRVQDRYSDDLEPDSFDIYIGDENGIQPMEHVSTIVAKDSTGGLFFITGPTRMQYDRIIPIMKLWHKEPVKRKNKKT